LAINLGVVFILAVINGVDFHWHILLLPLVLIELYVFALALAFLLSALYVKYRDIGHIWDVVMQAAFYATPIIYPISMVAATSTTFAKLLLLNPVAQMIQDARYLMVNPSTETVWNYIGNPIVAVVPLLVVTLFIILASTYFRHNSKQFAEEI
jgi:ABC-2 type transport system permease protein